MFQVPHVYPSNVYDWKHFCQTSTGEYFCILAQGFVRKLGLLTVGQESQRLPVVSIQQSLKLFLALFPRILQGSRFNLHLIAFPASPAHSLSFLLRAASIFTRVWTQCLLPGNRSRPREAEEWCWKKEAQADPTLHVVLGTFLTQTLFQAFTSEMAVRSSNFRWSSGV